MIEKILVLVIVGVVALMFFGNRLPQVLGDLGKGIKAFKEGMNEGSSKPKAKAGAKNVRPTKAAVKPKKRK
ncbi:MAG: twin-arginine translocase TatA/TatE family subunit [Alphaproteobacteria bacterium]|nr:MAG: twin-arginine translocase TatA/TatE family subunit [Alphaproteobacteria bacterium]